MLVSLVITFFVTLAFIVATQIWLGWDYNGPDVLVLVAVVMAVEFLVRKAWSHRKGGKLCRDRRP
jgi:hypothetical protein